MASIRVRPRKGKSPNYTVLWREPLTGKQMSEGFSDPLMAKLFLRLLEANGHQLNVALSLMDTIASRSPTVAAVLAEHIENASKPNDRTRADYRRDAERHINPYLGKITVADLTPDNVRKWLRDLAATDMADKTIANVHGLLSSAMKAAVQRGYRDGNPCDGVSLPRRSDHDSTEMRFLTHDEWARVDTELGKVLDGHYQLLFRVLAGTGIRWGELAALRVGDLSLDATPPTMRVTRAVKRDANMKAYVGTTKTSRSKRTVSLTKSLADQLRAHVAGMAPGDTVFTMRTGTPLHATNIRTRAWWPALKAAQIEPRPRIHDLRHTHASWLLAGGVDMLTVQRRLGHESILTTTNTYSHVLPMQQQAAADALEGIV